MWCNLCVDDLKLLTIPTLFNGKPIVACSFNLDPPLSIDLIVYPNINGMWCNGKCEWFSSFHKRFTTWLNLLGFHTVFTCCKWSISSSVIVPSWCVCSALVQAAGMCVQMSFNGQIRSLHHHLHAQCPHSGHHAILALLHTEWMVTVRPLLLYPYMMIWCPVITMQVIGSKFCAIWILGWPWYLSHERHLTLLRFMHPNHKNTLGDQRFYYPMILL